MGYVFENLYEAYSNKNIRKAWRANDLTHICNMFMFISDKDLYYIKTYHPTLKQSFCMIIDFTSYFRIDFKNIWLISTRGGGSGRGEAPPPSGTEGRDGTDGRGGGSKGAKLLPPKTFTKPGKLSPWTDQKSHCLKIRYLGILITMGANRPQN